jgi:hypothetical protein
MTATSLFIGMIIDVCWLTAYPTLDGFISKDQPNLNLLASHVQIDLVDLPVLGKTQALVIIACQALLGRLQWFSWITISITISYLLHPFFP